MGNVLSASYKSEPSAIDLGPRGSFQGLRFSSSEGEPLVRRFLNIPYALPATGQHRWRRTRALPSDHTYGSRDCTKFGKVCPQPRYTKLGNAETGDASELYDEDCLVVNVWAPAGAPPSSEGWPIMLWFHGGWLQVGDPSNDPAMDPTELLSERGANLQVVFVAAAYRLSVLGFLASKELQQEDPEGVCGNYSLWDQRQALDWVIEHGAYFGGDPKNIILAGRSAGAYSVHAQAAHEFFMRPERNSFRKMVMYSNAIPANPKTVPECQAQFDELVQACGIPASLSGSEKLARLREVDVHDLISKVMKLRAHTFRPVRDGRFFPMDLFERFNRGDFAREFHRRDLRLLIGEVKDEETVYRETNPPNDLESLREQVDNYYSSSVRDRLLDLYIEKNIKASAAHPDPNPDIDRWKKLYGDIVSDGQVRAPSRLLVRQLHEAGVPLSHVRRYLISWRPKFIDRAAPLTFGIGHAVDKPLWNFSVMHGPSQAEEKIMREWIQILTGFVRNEDSDFQTESWSQQKTLRSDGTIVIEEDDKWEYLKEVASAMAEV